MLSKESLLKALRQRGVLKTERIIAAFKKVKRENFVLDEYRDDAYGDYPLPILAGQTISQPTTVAIMLEALELEEGMKILEIGAGSGYNAALLGTIVGNSGNVISTEYYSKLVQCATSNLAKEGITNVTVIHTPHSVGYTKGAPYDRIIVTASTETIPVKLLEQLTEGGILLIPVGKQGWQKMLKIRKKEGKITQENLGDFSFVPFRK